MSGLPSYGAKTGSGPGTGAPLPPMEYACHGASLRAAVRPRRASTATFLLADLMLTCTCPSCLSTHPRHTLFALRNMSTGPIFRAVQTAASRTTSSRESPSGVTTAAAVSCTRRGSSAVRLCCCLLCLLSADSLALVALSFGANSSALAVLAHPSGAFEPAHTSAGAISADSRPRSLPQVQFEAR